MHIAVHAHYDDLHDRHRVGHSIFFSDEELVRSDWATFTMMSNIRFPFLERFEFVGVSIWLLVIIPNMSLYIWAASKGAKKMWHIKQKNKL